ncbi:hypothetical protein [uncultured Akkermansia sp.]|nr:hypothetical protein [uncultured Akkermansia sp.]
MIKGSYEGDFLRGFCRHLAADEDGKMALNVLVSARARGDL